MAGAGVMDIIREMAVRVLERLATRLFRSCKRQLGNRHPKCIISRSTNRNPSQVIGHPNSQRQPRALKRSPRRCVDR